MKIMRILFCGSRNFDNFDAIRDAIQRVIARYDDVDEFVCIHGGARGADKIAGYCAKQVGWTVEVYEAEWDKYGKSAGYKRNRRMLDEGKPDLVLAFRSAGESKGTDMMVDIAQQAKVPTYVYREAPVAVMDLADL